ncbi:ArsR/SmtB family transcription factor [Carboxydothermus hydrogenoformans]|uniref:Transcriptional regulator, ArsR family n=1 Tax=Carboxydothermus hydrogenoformans (strain ATCC BAA-161 / DSM 6008 / Z-2901) TaxID=246194 RepID=Q3ADS4_CARHZ|nr:metalloregulator ArsR/SmtB family transcription factor [Carboxydothermus hydrogenoformans]ABB14841.1 transcriptional regulator, ArsR family [Carboxydothermus hydrogenoformans Z-2901]
MKEKAPVCKVTLFDEETVQTIRQNLPGEETIIELSEVYKSLGDGTRLKILLALKEKESCVCDLAAALSMSQSAISHQLRVLRNVRLVKYRREGKMVYYSLDDEHILKILQEGLNHITHK